MFSKIIKANFSRPKHFQQFSVLYHAKYCRVEKQILSLVKVTSHCHHYGSGRLELLSRVK